MSIKRYLCVLCILTCTCHSSDFWKNQVLPFINGKTREYLNITEMKDIRVSIIEDLYNAQHDKKSYTDVINDGENLVKLYKYCRTTNNLCNTINDIDDSNIKNQAFNEMIEFCKTKEIVLKAAKEIEQSSILLILRIFMGNDNKSIEKIINKFYNKVECIISDL